MRIKHLAIADLWSYGPERTVIRDLGEVNVIIGKNNAGKSNLLKILRWASNTGRLTKKKKETYKMDPTWLHNSGPLGLERKPHLSLTFSIDLIDWPSENVNYTLQRIKALLSLLSFDDAKKLTSSLEISFDCVENETSRIVGSLFWDDEEEAARRFLAINPSKDVDAFGKWTESLVPIAGRLVSDKVKVFDQNRIHWDWKKVPDIPTP